MTAYPLEILDKAALLHIYFLRLAGAKISGDGTEQICIEGVKRLKSCEYLLPYDRIVAGTYLTAVAAAGGDAVIYGVVEQEQKKLLEVLEQCGCTLRLEGSISRNFCASKS